MKTMTKLMNLARVSVKTNIAKLYYVVAKMTINLNHSIIASIPASMSKQRFAATRIMSDFNNKTIVTPEAS